MYPGQHARTHPDKPAVIAARSGETITYAELDARSNRLAQLLWAEGLRPGDHLALFLENHLSYFEVAWAALRSGLFAIARSENSERTRAQCGPGRSARRPRSLVWAGRLA